MGDFKVVITGIALLLVILVLFTTDGSGFSLVTGTEGTKVFTGDGEETPSVLQATELDNVDMPSLEMGIVAFVRTTWGSILLFTQDEYELLLFLMLPFESDSLSSNPVSLALDFWALDLLAISFNGMSSSKLSLESLSESLCCSFNLSFSLAFILSARSDRGVFSFFSGFSSSSSSSSSSSLVSSVADDFR